MILAISAEAAAVADEVRAIVRGAVRPGETLEAAIYRLSRHTGIGERRLLAFAKSEARRIEAHERDRLRAYEMDRLERQLRQTEHELAVRRMRWGALPDDLVVAGRSGARSDERAGVAV